jgi:aminoglycoside 2''-phosphotransferase
MTVEMTLEDYRNWLRIQLQQSIAPNAAWIMIESGWDSRVLEVDGQWIFRVARWPEIGKQFRKELQLLLELVDYLPVAVPNPEFAWLDDPNFICMGYRKLNGEALSDAAAKTALAAQIGTFLSCLHQFPLDAVPQAGLLVLTPDEWRSKYLEFYQWMQKTMQRQVSGALWKNMRDVWDDFLGTEANFHFTPVLIHGDLGAEHLLVDPHSDRLVGVIDWGDACVGDPALDFTGLLASFGADFVSQALASYVRPVDSRFWRRMAFYRDILPFYQMHYGLEFGKRRYFLEGLQAFAGRQNKIETEANE